MFFLCFPLLFIGNRFLVLGQVIHFSQAYEAHLVLNPANTGRFNGDWRAVGAYRHQGDNLSNDYSTIFLSFEKPFYLRSEKINTGFFYSRDNSAGGTFPVDRLNISVASGVWLSGNSMLSAGIQVAYVHKQVNWNGITFPDQYNRDTGGFDPSLPTGDMREASTTSFLDLGLGLVYSKTLRKSVITVGYSLQQINQPTESFFDLEEKLPVKHFFHLKGDIPLSNHLFVIPSGVVVTQGQNNALLAGAHLGYNIRDWYSVSNSVIGGVHFRNAALFNVRSLVASVGLTWQFYKFMVSYDMPLGSAPSDFNNSALEFTFGFRIPSTDLNYKTIPCERY